MLSLLGVFQVDGHVGGTGLVDGDDGQREIYGAVEHDGHEIVGTNTARYQPLGQHVGAARQLTVGHAVGGVGHSQTVWMLAGAPFESLHKGHLRVYVEGLAATQGDECLTLPIADNVKLPKRQLGVSRHVAYGHPHGFGHHLERIGIVHGQTRFHAHFVVFAFQVYVNTEVGVGLVPHRLHGTNLDAIYRHVLLHIGHGHEVERYARLHL